MAYWLLKTEPDTYRYDDLEREGSTRWDGVRNAAALGHIRRMQPGDRAVIYHSGDERRAVGLAMVTTAAYADPEAADNAAGKLVVADIRAERRLPQPVPLSMLKEHPAFAGSPLVRISRLSVVPLTEEQYRVIAGE